MPRRRPPPDRATAPSAGAGGPPAPADPQPPAARRAPIDLPAGVAPLEPPQSFLEAAEALGLAFEPGDLQRLGQYLALLLAANKTVNLTGLTDPAEAWHRSILDALALLPILGQIEPQGDRLRLLDVGSGGGLPGMVLAASMPAADVTLLDATEKKTRFLRHAADELALANVTVIYDRAERAAHHRGVRVDHAGTAAREGALRDAFDAVTARALGRLPTLLELTVPFARVGGLCVLTKGGQADDELAEAGHALHLLHAAHAGTVDTPTGRLVVVEKLRPTPKTYPRADGEPKRKPLGLGPRTPDPS